MDLIQPQAVVRAVPDAVHHASAAARNAAVAEEAVGVLRDALAGSVDTRRILIKAAAGAGKSYVLKKMVADAVTRPRCERVAVIAFQNRQLWPLVESLGSQLGPGAVCLFCSKKRFGDVPDAVHGVATVVTSAKDIPLDVKVLVSTSHKLGAIGEHTRLTNRLGPAANGQSPFDVLFVDEAWQLPHHLFDQVTWAAPVHVGVGDVGQLPPLEIGQNPWRGDPSFNPYRAWPTQYENDPQTWETELPAVWRPTAEQLPLWRAFYPEWRELNCVAAPGDRIVSVAGLTGVADKVWGAVSTGRPALVEVDGLAEPDAADVDLPLMRFVEHLVTELFAAGFSLSQARYDETGSPTDERTVVRPGDEDHDPLVVILATRNQAVDDAKAAVERLRERFDLKDDDLVASTVDSWQGQTNGITVAIHPLTGASELDDFNSAFGRLAVTCTRATHGLLVVSRPGLDALLDEAPARPGNPFGEPGNRRLPRQTHRRILDAFTRVAVTVDADQFAEEGAPLVPTV